MLNQPTNTNRKILLLILLFAAACNQDTIDKKASPDHLFSAIPVSQSGVNFKNNISESNEFNFVNYLYIYNGGGVVIADFNNDGLNDIVFSSNQESNRIYLNKGDFEFEDKTSEMGIADTGGWTTGISAIDINNDGWMDLYVCRSGPYAPELRKNKLFINQQGKSFVESADTYGLADASYSTQAYFTDYDKDGDLDMYLVNHRIDWASTIAYNPDTERTVDAFMSDRLYRNDGNRFTDVSQQAGILNKAYGQSAAIMDYNNDGWDDIYVANDFIHGDFLYINNTRGGFTNEILNTFDHTSFFSMGSDIADINNDGLQDLVVLDMVAEDHVSNKRLMAGMSTSQFRQLVKLGNNYQYMTNVLQLNRGQSSFSEIAYSAGIANTDWSWAPLLADFDNDGLKDLYISNGIKRDVTDNDFKNQLKERAQQGYMNIEDVFAFTPSRKVGNYFFRNKGNTKFENRNQDFDLQLKTNSNGAAYGDLDNDGDLDLVVNNIDEYATVFRNNAQGDYLKVTLEGAQSNPLGLGSIIQLKTDKGTQQHVHYLARGYQSSVAEEIIFGLDSHSGPLSLEVFWPDGKYQSISNLKANKTVVVKHKDATQNKKFQAPQSQNILEKLDLFADVAHTENDYDDFVREILLPQKYSTLGPATVSADINGDGLQDIFFGGAHQQAAQLLIQQENGSFSKTNQQLWKQHADYEDIDACFFDTDGDGDMDLYVSSGGNEHAPGHRHYQDRLYINDGRGLFKPSSNIPVIKESSGKVINGDFDNDGDEDLFVAGRIVPGKYPMPASSYLLKNENGRFTDVSGDLAESLKEIGLVSDALFSDFDKDNDLDLLLVGEWMGLVILENKEGTFVQMDISDITGSGWWYSIAEGDFNNDGYPDYVLGNLGSNNKFGAKEGKSFHVFCNDFDQSGNLDIVLSKEKSGKFLPVRGRECSSQQMPFIKEKFATFKSFAEADLDGIYGADKLEEALHLTVDNFESVVLISDGSKNFKSKALPIQAQYGPSLDFVVTDLNKDGHLDIIGAGNIYNAEVETVRYDANKGYVLLGDGQGSFNAMENSGLLTSGNVKHLLNYTYGQQNLLIAVRNNDHPQVWSFN